QLGHDAEARMRASICRKRIDEQSERQPDVDEPRREAHARRHDADDGMRLIVQRDGPAEQCRIRVEAAAPQTIADDRNALRGWLVLAWSERSAALCLNADGSENV